MVRMGMAEAKTNLSKLVAAAEAGEEVVITRSGKAAVRLVIEPEKRPLSEFAGALKQEGFWMADDFDDFGEELQRMFGMLE